MKSKLIFMLLFSSLMLGTAKAADKSAISITLSSDDPRDVSKGENPGHTSRTLPVLPVLCTLEDGIICIEFLHASGELTVTISDAMSPVYMEQINVSAPTQVAIPVAGYAPGEYVIHFSDGNGDELYGLFVLY